MTDTIDFCKTCFHERGGHKYHYGENNSKAQCSMDDCSCMEYIHGETRVTSTTGAEKGTKEARYDLIPVPALDYLARLYGKGAQKYAEHNWRLGYNYSLSYAAAQRHMNAFWAGEDIDPETQVPHVINAAFHMFALATFLTEHPEMDDRFESRQPPEPSVQEVVGLSFDQMVKQMGIPVTSFVDDETTEVVHIAKIAKNPIQKAAKQVAKQPEGVTILFDPTFTDEEIGQVFDRAAEIQKEKLKDGETEILWVDASEEL